MHIIYDCEADAICATLYVVAVASRCWGRSVAPKSAASPMPSAEVTTDAIRSLGCLSMRSGRARIGR